MVNLNNTLDKINNSIDINKSIEKVGDSINGFDFKSALHWLGIKADSVSGWIVSKGSDVLNADLSYLTFKILELLLLVGVFYLALKIGKKPIKIILILLVILLIISIIASMFF